MSETTDETPKRVTQAVAPRAEPGDWICICISTYPADLEAADAVVRRFKAAGIRNMTRSRLCRIALAKLDVESVLAEEIARESGRTR